MSTSPRVARMAARARALPESVPPTPLTSASALTVIGSEMAEATAWVKPKAAAGTPPAIGLPSVSMSGSSPWTAV